jgi:4-methyl-5(b-hydroxyethyl)-thiazole monophosphate biosynthesis
VIAALERTATAGGVTAAICAAPLVLDRAGLLEGATKTSHPSVKEELPAEGYLEDRVVTSGKVVTSRAPGTAMEFAFTLLGELRGAAVVDEVNQGVLARL